MLAGLVEARFITLKNRLSGYTLKSELSGMNAEGLVVWAEVPGAPGHGLIKPQLAGKIAKSFYPAQRPELRQGGQWMLLVPPKSRLESGPRFC